MAAQRTGFRRRSAGFCGSAAAWERPSPAARRPEEYTVGMILRLTEGNMAPVTCMEDEVNSCSRSGFCVTLRLWEMIDEAVRGVTDHVTLADMVAWEREAGTADLEGEGKE